MHGIDTSQTLSHSAESPYERDMASEDAPKPTQRNRRQNVTPPERVGSGLAGLGLLYWAAGRPGILPYVAIAGAAGLLLRAATGRCPAKRALQASPYEEYSARSRGWSSAAVAERSITISLPREQVYQFWRDFGNLPRFMQHVEEVEVLTPQRSHWKVKAPFGKSVQWTSFVLEDIENERIAWESEFDADIPNAGWVEFRDAPGGRGTEVTAQITYRPPYGQAGRLASRLFLPETPPQQMADDLRRLKQILETGETAVSDSLSQR